MLSADAAASSVIAALPAACCANFQCLMGVAFCLQTLDEYTIFKQALGSLQVAHLPIGLGHSPNFSYFSLVRTTKQEVA
jgi:hypothetical protein